MTYFHQYRVLKWPSLEGSNVCGFSGLRQTRMSYLIRVHDVTATYGVLLLLTNTHVS
jgi:hypothetical protein